MRSNLSKKTVSLMIAGILLIGAISGGVVYGLHKKQQNDQIERTLRDERQMMENLLAYGKETAELLSADTIYPGVIVMGADLGGMTKDEAAAVIQEKIGSQVLDRQITLTYHDQEWTVTFEELGLSADADAVADKAYAIGRSGNLTQRRQIIETLRQQPEAVSVDTAFDEAKMDEVISQLAQRLDQAPVNASVSANGESFTVTEGKKGLSLDQAKTKEALKKAMDSDSESSKVALAVSETEPDRTAEKLATIHDKIGSYSTYYSTSNYGREQNLIVGASKINGTVLMPGETMSFNDMVAPITIENGYFEANVIVGDEYVPGLGGGLCQVSTTLYNAVIRAELEVVERDCHSFPASYVPLGLDAAVASGYIDFKFTNDSGYPVYIAMWCGGGEIGAAVYGTEIHDPSRSLSFDYVVTGEIPKPAQERVEDPSLAPGETQVVEGHTGYEVDVYKTVTENGTSQTEWFSSSSYMASADKVKVGPKKDE